MAILNFVTMKKYDELVVALKAAFEELRNENKINKENYDSKIEKIFDNSNQFSKRLEENEMIISRLQIQNNEMKNILLQMESLLNNLVKERTCPPNEVSMKKYQEIQTEKIPEEEIKKPVAPGIPPEYVEGYFENGTPKLNINEIPITVDPSEEIIKQTQEYKNKLKDEAKSRRKYVELYPEEAEDSARCTNCKRWIKVENPERGETPNTHQKMIEGRCPICKTYVVKIY